MHISLPSQLSGLPLLAFLNSIYRITAYRIELNFDSLRFIRPEGVVSLSNAILYLQKSGKEVVPYIKREFLLSKWDPVRYLDDCLFFEKLFGSKLNSASLSRSTTNGLEILSTKAIPQSYIIRTVNWLKYSLGFKTKSFFALETSLVEVFNNIIDHSSAIVGSSFAQHYPNEKRIILAISDFGVGIPTRIRERYPGMDSDGVAIEKATQPFVSSKSKLNNSGVGLSTIIDLLNANGGKLIIESKFGKLTVGPNERRIESNVYNKPYPGTLIHIIFRTDTLDEEEETREELEW